MGRAKRHQIGGARIRGNRMSPLLITEKDVEDLLRMEDALGAVEDGLRALGRGEATNRPRQRVGTREATVNIMLASWPARGYAGFAATAGTRPIAKPSQRRCPPSLE